MWADQVRKNNKVIRGLRLCAKWHQPKLQGRGGDGD